MTTSSTSALTTVISDANSIDLEDWGPLPEATAAPMATGGKKLCPGEGILEFGLWKCAPGPSRWLFETNESITVIEGRMTVSEDNGEAYDIGAGDSAVFAKGWSGTWDIHETVLKVYTVF